MNDEPTADHAWNLLRPMRPILHHLFRVEDGLAPRLATIHNLRIYSRLMELIAREVAPHEAPV